MADESDPQITFKVKTSGDGLHTITMAESATVLELKTKLATEEYENFPVERQRLIYSGRVMKNDDVLSFYKIKAGNTLHLVKSAASNHPPASSAAAAASATGSAPPPVIPANIAAGTPANDLLAGLTGARFAGHMPLPDQNIFGPDGGMNLPSEDQMAEMMSNPAVVQSVNDALSNPTFVDFLIQNNPSLRNFPNARELIQSPMFRSMLTDPNSLRMVNQMRRAMGGNGAAAFPAPGTTDNTPAGAPASQSATGGAAPAGADAAANPFGPFNPFGSPFAAAGGAGDGAAANPLSLFGFPFAAGGAGDGAAAAGAAANATRAGETPSGTTGAAGTAGTAGTTPAANPFASLFGNMAPPTPEMTQQALQMLQSLGGGAGNPLLSGAGAAAPPDNRPPEERYAEQLRQLNDMGFYDFDQNVAALRRSGGSVQGAIQHLLGD